jgi:DNA-binding NtrC family response regulator
MTPLNLRPGGSVMSHRRILVVDDEPNTRLALAELLRDEGYEVETAEDGADALAKLAGCAAGLALIDLNLPGMGGLALLAEIKARDPACSVVLLTSYDAAEAAAMRAGAAGYLVKPIDLAALFLAIERALAPRSQHTAG